MILAAILAQCLFWGTLTEAQLSCPTGLHLGQTARVDCTILPSTMIATLHVDRLPTTPMLVPCGTLVVAPVLILDGWFASGRATWSLAIPADPALLGQAACFQAWVSDDPTRGQGCEGTRWSQGMLCPFAP